MCGGLTVIALRLPSNIELYLRIDGDGVEYSDRERTAKSSWRAIIEMSEHHDCVVVWFRLELRLSVLRNSRLPRSPERVAQLRPKRD